ncbi:MAG TPA: hypothetical protein VK498_11730, partial [Ferruginibacter sp.]|nr:hypothetical protein [Ferruginibacter sp.]
MNKISFASFVLLIILSLQANCQDFDMNAVNKIRNEGFNNSRVMDIAFHLTDASGPRLTASPGFKRAANWAKDEMIKMGLKNVAIVPWGEFGQGWEQTRSYVAMTSPYYVPLIAIPRAWTGSTPGSTIIESQLLVIKAKDSAELYNNYTGKIAGRAVLIYSTDTLKPSFMADGERLADTSLLKMANALPPVPRPQNAANPTTPNPQMDGFRQRQAYQRSLMNFFKNEKPAIVLSMSRAGNDGTLFVQNGGAYTKDAENNFAWVMLSSDDYLRIQRLSESGIPVKIEAD